MKAARWGKGLTCPVKYGIINSVTYGEMSERFKELVLKTSDSERGRGFESHLLRYAEAGYRVLQRFIIMKVSLL